MRIAVGFALLSLLGTALPATAGFVHPFSGTAADGNLFGAAEACGFSTVGLPYLSSPAFENARQIAHRSRQDCPRVANTLAQVRSGSQGAFLPSWRRPGWLRGTQQRTAGWRAGAYDQGNLFGATEACGFSTAGLPYINSPEFETARETARRSRQDCPQVANTLGGNAGGFQAGFGGYRPSAYDQGNLFGATEACGFSTAGLPYINSTEFETGRQTARRSRQDCPQVADTLARISGRPW